MTTCPGCGAATSSEQRFCGECGAALAATCPHCRAPVRPGQRFCGECGAAISSSPGAASAVPVESTPEVRLVSVLFVDLVGFTSLSEAHDAEDMRDLLSRYFAVARTVVGRYGGTIEKFIGDAVMAVWGTPVAHEDDANRAVRAALDLVAGVEVFAGEVGAPQLRARGGVATGRAASWASSGEGLVVGDRVNTASRVQSAASPGTVLVDQLTREATARSIEYRDGGVHEVKGKSEPLHLFRAVRAIQKVPGRDGHPLGAASLHGRDAELRILRELFHSTIEKRGGHLVALSGPAGIGKSVLLEELARYVHGLAIDVLWHEGSCALTGDGVAYGALVAMVRQRLRLEDSGTAEEAVDRLHEALRGLLPSDEDFEFATPKLEVLLGLPTQPAEWSRDELFAGWRLLFEALARTAPVVMVVDNLQWANQGLLDFLEHLLDWSSQLPILIITQARPELLQIRPGWAADQRHATTLHLDPLSPAEMGQLLDDLVAEMPSSAHRQIVERAEGIPLYAVETIHMLTDRGLIQEQDGRRVLAEELSDLDTPVSLEALIAARLDELPLDERALVKDLAVLGMTFSKELVASVTTLDESALESLLRSLLRKEVLVTQGGRRPASPALYGFSQTLLRSIAYDRLGKRERRSRHLAVASQMSLSPPADLEELAEVIGEHYRQAALADPRAADTAQVGQDAVRWLIRAASRAATVGAPGRAMELYLEAAELAVEEMVALGYREQAARMAFRAGLAERCLTLLEQLADQHIGAGRVVDAARLAGAIGSSLGRLGRADEAIGRLSRALEVLDLGQLDADVAEIQSQLARELSVAGRREEAMEHVEHALRIAEALDLPQVLCDGLETKALLLRSADRPEEALLLFDGTVEIAGRRGLTSEEMLSGQANSGDTRMANDIGDAISHLESAIGLARRLGQRYSETFLGGNLLLALIFSGEWRRATELAESLLEEDRPGVEIVQSRLVVLNALRGNPQLAREAFSALQRWEHHNSTEPRTLYAALEATVLLAEGELPRALEAARGALEVAVPNFGYRHEIARQAWPDACEAALGMGSSQKLAELVRMLESEPPGRLPPYLRWQLARYRALGALGPPGEPAGVRLLSVSDGFGALGYPYWAARTGLEAASRGSEGDAAADSRAQQARQLLLAMGAPPPL